MNEIIVCRQVIPKERKAPKNCLYALTGSTATSDWANPKRFLFTLCVVFLFVFHFHYFEIFFSIEINIFGLKTFQKVYVENSKDIIGIEE